MSVTLYSPNPGATGVADHVLATLNRYGNAKLDSLNIALFDGNDKEREQKTQSFRLSKHAHLFLVERIAMPNPKREGRSVLVYRTTLQIRGKVYIATRYTNIAGSPEPRVVDLSPEKLEHIREQLGHSSLAGMWESLLRTDRLERLSVF